MYYLILAHALPMFRESKPKTAKKKEDKDRQNPVASHKPELPVTGPGTNIIIDLMYQQIQGVNDIDYIFANVLHSGECIDREHFHSQYSVEIIFENYIFSSNYT